MRGIPCDQSNGRSKYQDIGISRDQESVWGMQGVTECILRNCSELPDPAEVREILGGLSEARVEKILRYKRAEDRKRSAMAGMMIRDELPRFGISQEQIRTSEKDRPFVDGETDFNLSHSGDYVLMAVSDGRVGCDIEQVKAVRERVLDHCCSEAEKIWCRNFPEAKRASAFCRIWTAKESYIKMTGEGLSLGFSKYEIVPDESAGILREPILADDAEDSKQQKPAQEMNGSGEPVHGAGIPEEMIRMEGADQPEYLGCMKVLREGKKEPCVILQMKTQDGYVISVCVETRDAKKQTISDRVCREDSQAFE